MTRWSGTSVRFWLAIAFAVPGCIGGQTGDPGNAGSCVTIAVPRDKEVSGVSPAELARAYQGRHTATLTWNSRDGGAPYRDDQITVVITYDGADGSMCDNLGVPIGLQIATR